MNETLDAVNQKSRVIWKGRSGSLRLSVYLGVAVLTAILIAAFVHLLLVSIQSQPDCVPHSKAGEASPAGSTAAKSSC